MFSNDEIRVQHILDAAREAVGFIKNRHRQDLDTDRQLNLSVVRLLEITGEAARGISTEFLRDHPDVAWKKMAGMRDRLVHGYFDINLDIVWETLKDDLPGLIEQLEKIEK